MGVRVRVSTSDTRTAALSVIANSRIKRPTTPPMNIRGVNTAISEIEIERMVKLISPEPASAASSGFSPSLDMLPDHFHHHDGVVHHEAHRDGERHQGQIVQAEVQREHHGGGAQQRQRDHCAGDQGGADIEQEQEDHQHHQGNRDQQCDFHIRHRGADGLGAVHQDIDLDPGRNIGLQARQRRLGSR